MTDPGRPPAPPRRDALIVESVATLVAGAREIVPIAALVTLPLIVLSSFIVLPGLFDVDYLNPFRWLTSLPTLLGIPLISGLVSHTVFCRMRGVRATAGRSLLVARRRLGSLVLVSVLYSTLTFLGLRVYVVPGLYVAIAFAFAAPAAVTENLSPPAAFARGWRIARGRWWSLFGVYLAFVVFAYIVRLPVAIALRWLHEGRMFLPILGMLPAFALISLGATAAAVGYHRLRGVESWNEERELARVFD